MSLQIDIITLFPEYFATPLATSLVGKAIANRQVIVNVQPLRQFGVGKHQLTDDRPFGGGAGMVMLVEPIDRALTSLGYRAGTPQEAIWLTSAKGQLFDQTQARQAATLQRLCLICGHYEGVDERVATHLVDAEVRIGDYVLTGGEPATAVITDTVVRLLPGVLGNATSLEGESHNQPGELGHNQYSRPATYRGWRVPEVLLSGDHAAISDWRQKQHRLS